MSYCWEYDIAGVIMGIKNIAYVCDDHVTIYKHSASGPLHRTINQVSK